MSPRSYPEADGGIVTVGSYSSLWLGDLQLTTNRPRRVVIDLPMPRNGTLTSGHRIDPDRVSPAFPEQVATMPPEVPDQVRTFHENTPAGTSRTSELAS